MYIYSEKTLKIYHKKRKYAPQIKNIIHKWEYFLKYPQVKKYRSPEVVLEGGVSLVIVADCATEGKMETLFSL